MEDAGGPAGGQSGLLPDQESGDLQIAQATIAGARGDAIGIVNEATGDVFIVHKDGTSEQAVAGMPVFADDIVATGTDGAVEVVFKDGTTFSLGSNGQMRLDNLIYDPAGNDNGLDATIVKGSFVFITGNVGSAEGEGVSIDTPAGTIGIRGTSGGVAQDPQTGTWIFTLFRDPDGTLSRFVVTNPAGQQLLDQEFETTEVAGRLIAPSQTIVLSPAQAAALFAGALQLLEQQFPQLQRSELENVDPAAGEPQFAVDPGQHPPSAESLAELFGLDALGDALAELLGNDEGQNWGEARSVATSTFVPAAQSSPIILGSDDNAATEDGGTNPIGNVLDNDTDVTGGAVLGVSAVNGSPANVGEPTPGTYGTLQLNADGTYVYTLDNDNDSVQALGEGQTATDVFTYTVTDGLGHTATATLTITVTGTNDLPVAEADVNAAPEDTGPNPVSGNVLANDKDVDNGDQLTVSTVNESADNVGTPIEGTYGTLQLNANGSYSYTLDNSKAAVQALGEGEEATDEFSYTISDGHGGNATAMLTITVTGTNDDPVANPDEATTAEDTPVTISVLANDSDLDGDPLTVTQATALYGTVVINDDGTLTYTPAADYNGPDTISYSIDDGHGGTAGSTVAVTVTATNDAPVANPDAATTAEDTPVTIAVLDNDTDTENDVLTVTAATALHGTIAINDDGTLTYTPAADYNGPDTISYSIDDGHGGTAASTVAVTVTGINDDPVANPDEATTAEDTPVTIAVLDNDTDVDFDDLTISGASALHGTVTINGDGTLTYTPAADYNGPDTITYSIDDGHGGTAVSTVAVAVTAVNDDPVANPDAATTAEDTPVTIAVLDNDTDTENDVLTVTAATALHGTVVINDDGTLTYTPAADYNGPDTITYSIDDGLGGTAKSTVAVTVTAVNDDPVANPDEATTAEDTPVTIAVLDNDTDTENDALTVTAATALHGTVVINDDGTLTYTPAADYNGPDTISYSIDDGHGGTAGSTVSVTVTAVNDDPVANPDAATTAEDTPVTIAVLDNDTDTENDVLTVTAATALHGTVAINNDGTLTYTPAADYNGPDTITYSIADGNGGTAESTVAVTVTAVNDAPVAAADAYSTDEDTVLTVPAPGVLSNDTDVDGDKLSAVLVEGPAHGTLEFGADGSFVYTPTGNFNGEDSFSYQADDGSAGSEPVTVILSVNAVNDAPVAKDDKATTAEDTSLILTAASLLANDTDADSDALTILSVGAAAHGTVTLNKDGSVSYAPNADYNGPDSFSYTVSDGHGGTSTAQVNLTVTPVNDPPAAQDDSYHVVQGKTLTVNAEKGVLVSDTDVEGDTLTVTGVSSQPAHGELTLNADGSFSYTPNGDYEGTDTFTYKVSDGQGGTAEAKVTIVIDDSVPKAAGESVKTADTAPKTVDLVIILDRSGSMNDPSGVAGVSTRLELARAAIAALFEAYQSIADLHIQIVDFADGAASSGWLSSPEAANAYLASLVASGGTNYAAALEMAMAAYDGAPPADQTEVYFLSDGAPTQSLTAAQIAEWEGFLDTNDVDKALAVGIGAGIQSNDPDLAAVAYPNGDPGNPIVVTQTSQLIATLVGTVDNPISGNVLTNDDFGADGKGNGGGGLLSIKVGDVTYSFDGKNILNEATGKITAGAILVVEPTLIGGLLEFDFDSGDYTFTPPDVTATKFEEFEYTIVDGDGDQDKAVLHIDITDSGITVVDPSVIFGTDASKATNDNLAGTTRDDIMSGGAGNDTVSGGEGNDHIQGGAGTDALLGGAGIDILIGGAGNDTLDGGAGANALVGGDGDDRIVVGAGDRADGGGGNDSFILVDNAGFAAIQGGGTTELSLSADGGDVLAFNGTLDITKFAADKILGIETISMTDGLGGAGADKLVINAGDVMDIGSGQLNPAGAFGAFGELPNAAAIRVNGDDGDSLTLSGSGWQQVTSGPGGVPGGYVLYMHDSPADGAAADAYVLVQTAVKVTTG